MRLRRQRQYRLAEIPLGAVSDVTLRWPILSGLHLLPQWRSPHCAAAPFVHAPHSLRGPMAPVAQSARRRRRTLAHSSRVSRPHRGPHLMYSGAVRMPPPPLFGAPLTRFAALTHGPIGKDVSGETLMRMSQEKRS